MHELLELVNAILKVHVKCCKWSTCHRFIDDKKGFVLGNDGVLLRYLG